MMWAGPFEELVRAQITFASDEPLRADCSLTDHGLDSLATVTLLLELEQAYAVVFPDEALVPDTFATVGSLWSVVSGLIADAGRVGAAGV
jgi:acyl carrier protein